jgi:two-component sensor histidine kinase
MFVETQNRILSMANLHEKLYQSEDLKHVNIQEHFTSLINDLVRDYEVGIDIELDIDIEDVNFGLKTLVPLGLLVNELISNALMHGFKGEKEGVLTIYLKKLDKLNHELVIGDNGVGMDKDFNVKEASSLGTKLVQIFVEQLEGIMERLDEPGTQYKIVFEKID